MDKPRSHQQTRGRFVVVVTGDDSMALLWQLRLDLSLVSKGSLGGGALWWWRRVGSEVGSTYYHTWGDTRAKRASSSNYCCRFRLVLALARVSESKISQWLARQTDEWTSPFKNNLCCSLIKWVTGSESLGRSFVPLSVTFCFSHRVYFADSISHRCLGSVSMRIIISVVCWTSRAMRSNG